MTKTRYLKFNISLTPEVSKLENQFQRNATDQRLFNSMYVPRACLNFLKIFSFSVVTFFEFI